MSEYRAVSGPKNKTPPKRVTPKDISGFLNTDKSGKSEKRKEKGYINSLFREFIEKYLKGLK